MGCEIGDEGVASLVDNLDKDDFRALEGLCLTYNTITGAGMAKLVVAIDAGWLPNLRGHEHFLDTDNPASASAVQAVMDALSKRAQ